MSVYIFQQRMLKCKSVMGKSQIKSTQIFQEMDLNHLTKSQIPIFLQILHLSRSNLKFFTKINIKTFSIESPDRDV